MNFALIGFILLTSMGWGMVVLYDKRIKEKERELYQKNTEIRILYTTIAQLKISKGGGERIIYRNRPVEIPKGTIDAVKLAMKVSHPDNGGNNADFIKYNEIYQKLTGKGRK